MMGKNYDRKIELLTKTAEARCIIPDLIKDKHMCNNEYYVQYNMERFFEYDNKFYYICNENYKKRYICVSNNDGTNIKIIAELTDYFEGLYVNITGIYAAAIKDYGPGQVKIVHYNFDGQLLSECVKKYPSDYEGERYIDNLCFYDTNAYYAYSNQTKRGRKTKIICMDVDNHQVYTVYEKASEIKRLFALKDKLIFHAYYEKETHEVPYHDGWMILDLETREIECLSNLEEIVSFDFNRNIFWTEREALEGKDSKHLEEVRYREPRNLWGDRKTVIPDLPVWRIKDTYYSYPSNRREYFDGIHRYYSDYYYTFTSTDKYGNIYIWKDAGHGLCNEFKVLGESLFLNISSEEEEQYRLSFEKKEAIRKSWFDNNLDQKVLDAFYAKTHNEDLTENETVTETTFFKDSTVSDENQDGREDKRVEDSQALSDLSVEKVIGKTDIKYNICTFGAKFHIGFGRVVTIQINGKTYEGKTHNSVKGRIDGMKKLFVENDIKLGDHIVAKYYENENYVLLIKK